AGKILDRDLGVRDARADQSRDIACSHGHGAPRPCVRLALNKTAKAKASIGDRVSSIRPSSRQPARERPGQILDPQRTLTDNGDNPSAGGAKSPDRDPGRQGPPCHNVGVGCRHDGAPDPRRTRRNGGSGLGLAIARHIARSHRGDITLGDSPQGGLPAAVRVPV
ncbi:MAG TPA: hypothetical protein VN362_01570, partial [Xanthobacteraceae bacterium]|nr:hypothetical protein [Xanthobacteraceae bacterium]